MLAIENMTMEMLDKILALKQAHEYGLLLESEFQLMAEVLEKRVELIELMTDNMDFINTRLMDRCLGACEKLSIQNFKSETHYIQMIINFINKEKLSLHRCSILWNYTDSVLGKENIMVSQTHTKLS